MKTTIDPQQAFTDGLDRARWLIRALPPELVDIGYGWYPAVHDQVRLWSIDTGYSEGQCAAVLAQYNRNQMWTASKTHTRRALYHGHVGGMPSVRHDVERILALPRTCRPGDIVPLLTRGSKTQNFYWACLDVDGCPIDRHIFRVWRLRQGERWYALVQAGVEELAREMRTEPRHAEAVLWLAQVYVYGKPMSIYLP